MSHVLSYDSMLKCVSAVICVTVVSVIIVETDLLPSQIRQPLRGAVHQTADEVTRIPAVRDILRVFH